MGLTEGYVPPIYRIIATVHGWWKDLQEARFVAQQLRK